MEKYCIDGTVMTDRASAHAEIKRAMDFPDYYGCNLDALWDMISTLQGDVVLTGAAQMLNALEGYGCRLLKTFYEAAEGKGFTFRVE